MRWLVLWLVFLICGCSQKYPSQFDPKHLAAQNYHSQLAAGKFIPIDTPASKVPQQFRQALTQQQQLIGQAVPIRALTPTEKNLVGLWIGPAQPHCLLTESFVPACFYYQKHGRLPNGAEELLSDFLTPEVVAALRDYSQQTQPYLDEFTLSLVNVSTGHLYDSFEDKQWKKFGINIAVMNPGRVGFMKRLEARLKGQSLNTYYADFEVTVYGEEPGTTIYKAIWHAGAAGRGLIGDPF